MKEHFDIEDTSKLIVDAKRSTRRRFIPIAVITVAVVVAIAGFFGFRTIAEKRYNEQIAIADKSFAEGNYQQAETEYLTAVNMNKRKTKAREGLAYVYAIQGKSTEAIDIYESLYKEKKDETYRDAIACISDGRLPTDSDIIPAHGIWRQFDMKNLPYSDSLADFLCIFCYESFDYEDRNSYDCTNVTNNIPMLDVMTGLGAYGYPIEYYVDEKTGWNYNEDWVTTVNGLDPRGWGREDFDLYESHQVYDIEKTDWIMKTVFNVTDEDIERMLQIGERDRIYYKQDGHYYCATGWPTGFSDPAIQFTGSIWTDGMKYCISFDTGSSDYEAEEYSIYNLDRSDDYQSYYAVVEPKKIDGKHYWSIYYCGSEMPKDVSEALSSNVNSSNMENNSQLPNEINEIAFSFSSGAGAWSTTLNLHSDGSFVGEYHDSDMGDTGPGYPGGIVRISKFSGMFGSVTAKNDTEYRLKVSSMKTEETAGKEYIQDGIKYIVSEPYGIAVNDEFALYMPNSTTANLPRGFVEWIEIRGIDSSEYSPVLKYYGLYNINGEQGFLGSK